MSTFKDRVALVTGGSRGIGKAVAIALARDGCNIAITARDQEGLRKTEKELLREKIDVLSFRADVRDSKAVQELARMVTRKFGAIHFLINNAGIGRFSEVVKIKDEDFRAVIETNLMGAFYCTKAFLPGMIEHKRGHIVNIASLAGKNNFAGGAAYCSSKHALMSFSECLMMEVRQYNIKVTTICPGTVQTEFGNKGEKDKSWALTSEDVAEAVVGVLKTSGGSLISEVDLRPLRPSFKK
jgi:3-oxoacyl-[acyl-carrier protein] reductase